MHQIARLDGAPASASTCSARRTVSEPSTFGSRIASAPARAIAVRSACPHGVSNPLTRTISSRHA